MKNNEIIKQIIDNENSKGNIVIATFEGLEIMPLSEFVKQGADGILYDLNRGEATTYALARENKIASRWVNDIAVAQVIKELKKQIELCN